MVGDKETVGRSASSNPMQSDSLAGSLRGRDRRSERMTIHYIAFIFGFPSSSHPSVGLVGTSTSALSAQQLA